MVFQAKKVPMETLGEYLTEIRKHLGLSINTVAKETGIPEKFLKPLEKGEYAALPPSVYVCGFLKKLANFYQLAPDELLEQYKKEQGIVSQAKAPIKNENSSLKDKIRNLVVTPKLISIIGVSLVLLIALGYIVFQVSAINRTPSLEISQPQEGSKVKDTIVQVAGKTDPGALVTINGENVLVNTDGQFNAEIGVVPGQKELSIDAHNKFGKQTSRKILVVVEPIISTVPEVDSTSSAKEEEKLSFEINFSRSANIVLTADGVILPEEEVAAGSVKRINVNDKLVIKTSDAGATNVVMNGKDFGILGRSGESLTVPFTSEVNALVNSKSKTN